MTTPANSVPAIIRADAAGNLYYSLDGGRTFNPAVAGGTGVASVTGAVSGIVDNADPANPVIESQSFGSDALFRADFAALCGPGLLMDSFYDPFTDSNSYDISKGTNAAVVDTTYSGGVLTGPHGGTGTAYIWEHGGIPAGTGAVQATIANPSAISWGCGGHVAFALSPNASTICWLATLQSNVDDAINLYLLGSTSTTILQLVCDGSVSGSGSVTVAANSVGTLGSGITVGANNFYRYLIGFNAQTGVLHFGVNGVSCGTITPGTKMPTEKMSPAIILAGLADVAKAHGMWCGWGAP